MPHHRPRRCPCRESPSPAGRAGWSRGRPGERGTTRPRVEADGGGLAVVPVSQGMLPSTIPSSGSHRWGRISPPGSVHQLRLGGKKRWTVRSLPPGPVQRARPFRVTRPVIASIASVTRRSWRRVGGARDGLQHVQTLRISRLGGCSSWREVGGLLPMLHGVQPSCLTPILAMVLGNLIRFSFPV